MIIATNYKMKPPVSARPVVGRRLAKGLVGCWLMNEGAGSRPFDISGYGNDATFIGTAGWRPSPLGTAMDSQGSGQNASTTFDGTEYDELSISAWVIPDLLTSTRYVVDNSPGSVGFGLRLVGTQLDFFCFSGGSAGLVSKSNFFSTGQLCHIAAVHNSSNILYGNGLYLNEANSAVGIDSSTEQMQIGGDYKTDYGWDGAIVLVQVWSRSLSAAEIAWLYREPFAMFDGRGRVELVYAPATSVVSIAGASSGKSGADGSLGVAKRLSGSGSAKARAKARLRIGDELPGIMSQRFWFKGSLFAGMTSNAFKLGTTLSLGWFWTRIEGCSVLNRGPSMEDMDFESVLSVSNTEDASISPPACTPHQSNSRYFYAVRRFNRCGLQERTLAAAVSVSIRADGNMAEPQPNSVFSSTAEVTDGDKVRLRWFYSALQQKSPPARFKIYHDDRTGEIDYENPIAAVEYAGQKFYGYKSSSLPAGRYLFAVRAEDAGCVEDASRMPLRTQMQSGNPGSIGVLSVEAV